MNHLVLTHGYKCIFIFHQRLNMTKYYYMSFLVHIALTMIAFIDIFELYLQAVSQIHSLQFHFNIGMIVT